MNVFVTGGTGFIGRALVAALLRRGWQVTVLARRPESEETRAVENLGARVVRGDIGSRDTLRDAMLQAGIGRLPGDPQQGGIVIHNAGWYEFGVPKAMQEEMHQTNLRGAENVLSQAVELGAWRVVHISSIVAHGPTGDQEADETYHSDAPPVSLYQQTKTAAHAIARRWQQNGAPVIIASPAGVVGPGDHSTLGYYLRLYVRGFGLPLMSRGSRSIVHVDDCAEAIALAAEKGRPGEEYILSGGTLSNKEMVKTWFTAKGGPRFMIWLPRGFGDVATWMTEKIQRLAGLPNIISREVFITGSVNWIFSGAKAERELGACFRDPRQSWLDAIEGERARMQQGKSWKYIGP